MTGLTCLLMIAYQAYQRIVSGINTMTSLLPGFKTSKMVANVRSSAWMPNTDLTPLDPASIDTTDTKGKSKPLVAAYVKASEDNDLQHYKDLLEDHQKAVEEEQKAQVEQDAKRSTKPKRKSVGATAAAAAADDEDEMDVDEEEAAPKPKSKKRKKEAESDGEEKVSLFSRFV